MKLDHFRFQKVLHVTWTTSLYWQSFENVVCIFWEIVKFHSLKTSNKCYVLDLKDSFVQLNFITSFWWCKSKIKRWNQTRLSWSRSVTTLQAYWLDIWDNNFCWLRASFKFEESCQGPINILLKFYQKILIIMFASETFLSYKNVPVSLMPRCGPLRTLRPRWKFTLNFLELWFLF